MKRSDDFKLRVLSEIREDIIDKNTDLRTKLIRRPRMNRKKLVAIYAVAACLLLIGGGLLAILPTLMKQVPVYQGMTVSNDAPTVMQYGYPGEVQGMPISAPSVFGESKKNDKDKDDKKKEALRDALDVTGADRGLYYAKQNEDVYITIHINNPDDFEILSFTLNGEKYSSYMFEQGSNMENIVIKVNVGDAEGIVDYTIDAIKYVDGTEIKDVRMEGDRTVKIGIYTEQQPTANVDAEKIGSFDLSCQVTVSDELSLIKASQGEAYALLMDGETVVAKKPLDVGKTQSVSFDGLQHTKEYEIVIVACYDALDGQGFAVHILEEKTVQTSLIVEITNLLVGENGGISFEINQSQSIENRIEKIELIDSSGNVVATGDASARRFDGDDLYLESYIIKVTYTYVFEGQTYTDIQSSNVIFNTRVKASLIMKNGEISKKHTTIVEEREGETTITFEIIVGIDITPAAGLEGDKKVYAAAPGTVKKIWNDPAMGYCVYIKTQTPDGELKIIYKCLDQVTVKAGDVILGGTALGVAKSSSYEQEDPDHTHIEITDSDGLKLDPTEYIY